MDEEQLLPMVKRQHPLYFGVFRPDFPFWPHVQRFVNTSSHLTERRLRAVLVLFSEISEGEERTQPCPATGRVFSSLSIPIPPPLHPGDRLQRLSCFNSVGMNLDQFLSLIKDRSSSDIGLRFSFGHLLQALGKPMGERGVVPTINPIECDVILVAQLNGLIDPDTGEPGFDIVPHGTPHAVLASEVGRGQPRSQANQLHPMCNSGQGARIKAAWPVSRFHLPLPYPLRLCRMRLFGVSKVLRCVGLGAEAAGECRCPFLSQVLIRLGCANLHPCGDETTTATPWTESEHRLDSSSTRFADSGRCWPTRAPHSPSMRPCPCSRRHQRSRRGGRQSGHSAPVCSPRPRQGLPTAEGQGEVSRAHCSDPIGPGELILRSPRFTAIKCDRLGRAIP